MLVDFHTHILPQIDDGSRSLGESIDLLKMEAEQGIKHVVVTPHFYAQHDSPDHFLKRRKAAEQQLREEMKKYDDLPEVTVGAEVYYFSGMSESEILHDLTIGETEYILIEMPMSLWTDAMYRELSAIRERQGLIPIVAHVDRYIGPFRTHGIPKRLEELPVLVQANAEFFLRNSTKRMAYKMLKEGKIHVLGSDCHNLKDRKPNMGSVVEAIKQRTGLKELERIRFYENAILHLHQK